MRSKEEVSRAHDIIAALMANPELVDTIGGRAETLLSCQKVLCWMLHHNSGVEFGSFVDHLEKIAHDLGYELTEIKPSDPEVTH